MPELNEKYKNAHKPQRKTEKQKFTQGYYVPTRHPDNCFSKQWIFRGSGEYHVDDYCDRCDAILRWATEPIAIEYLNPIANQKYCMERKLDWKNPIYWKRMKYYPDVWIEIMGPDGKSVRKIFIEIKPYDQSVAPKQPKPDAKLKEHKAYNRLATQYLINQQKWAAAKKFCAERGAEFAVYTEVELKKLGII